MQEEKVTPGTFFYQRLDQCLAKAGWSKTELSRQLKVTHPAVLKWWPTNGKPAQLPSSENLMKLSALFGVRADWLLNGDGEAKDWAAGLREDSAAAQAAASEMDPSQMGQVIFDLTVERRRTEQLEKEVADLKGQLEKLKKAVLDARALFVELVPEPEKPNEESSKKTGRKAKEKVQA